MHIDQHEAVTLDDHIFDMAVAYTQHSSASLRAAIIDANGHLHLALPEYGGAAQRQQLVDAQWYAVESPRHGLRFQHVVSMGDDAWLLESRYGREKRHGVHFCLGLAHYEATFVEPAAVWQLLRTTGIECALLPPESLTRALHMRSVYAPEPSVRKAWDTRRWPRTHKRRVVPVRVFAAGRDVSSVVVAANAEATAPDPAICVALRDDAAPIRILDAHRGITVLYHQTLRAVLLCVGGNAQRAYRTTMPVRLDTLPDAFARSDTMPQAYVLNVHTRDTIDVVLRVGNVMTGINVHAILEAWAQSAAFLTVAGKRRHDDNDNVAIMCSNKRPRLD